MEVVGGSIPFITSCGLANSHFPKESFIKDKYFFKYDIILLKIEFRASGILGKCPMIELNPHSGAKFKDFWEIIF